MTSLILQPGRLQPLPSLQTLTKSQAGETLGICLSILTNLTLSLSPKGPSGNPLPPYILVTCNHSNSWVSLSAMIFLGQATFRSWPPKPAVNWAHCIVRKSFLCTHKRPYTDKVFISSLMEYCFPIWAGSPASHPAQLDSMEIKAFRDYWNLT